MPQSGRLTKELEARGTVVFERLYNVYAPFSGQLDTVSVRKGDGVRAHMEIASYIVNSTDADVNVDFGYTIRRIRADFSGSIVSLNVGDGQFVTRGESLATVGINNGVFTVTVSCDGLEGDFINLGDEAGIYLNGSSPAANATVREITGDDGRLNVTLVFESAGFTGGEYVTARFSKQTEVYDALVPNESVVIDGAGSYVWTVQSREGAFGVEYFSVKTRVFIADSDDYYSAVSRGLEYYAPVIVTHDRELGVNGRVSRLE
jgi:multidrug efflux pump subunit AcrA (membrane-fusion protein)